MGRMGSITLQGQLSLSGLSLLPSPGMYTHDKGAFIKYVWGGGGVLAQNAHKGEVVPEKFAYVL